MYVRTTYVTGDPAEIDQTLDGLLAEAVKLLSSEPGYRGLGLFADRELGKIVTGSWWETAGAAQGSDEHVRQRRAELLAPFAASVTVDTLEALAFTPSPQVGPGGGFRLGRFLAPPHQLERLTEQFTGMALPAFEAVPGFAGAAMLADRVTGRGSVGTLWADRAALVASRGPQAASRARAAAAVLMSLIALEEFEVVLLDRRD